MRALLRSFLVYLTGKIKNHYIFFGVNVIGFSICFFGWKYYCFQLYSKRSKRSNDSRRTMVLLVERFMRHPKIFEWKENVKKSNQGWEVTPVNGLYNETFHLAQEILRSLGLELIFLKEEYYKKHVNYDIKATPANEDEVNKYLPCLISEITLYSRSLFENCKIKKIILCQEGYVNGQYRPAIPDWGGNQLFFTCKEAVRYNIEVIHHELYHYIDYIRVGTGYTKDEEWRKLNHKDFSYGTGGVNNR
jgi:hypothetical protein